PPIVAPAPVEAVETQGGSRFAQASSERHAGGLLSSVLSLLGCWIEARRSTARGSTQAPDRNKLGCPQSASSRLCYGTGRGEVTPQACSMGALTRNPRMGLHDQTSMRGPLCKLTVLSIGRAGK